MRSPPCEGGRSQRPISHLRKAARLGLAALLAALGVGCDRWQAPIEAHPLHFYDHLDRAEVRGVAAALVEGIPPGEERTVLALDFEEGGLGPLVPFAGYGSTSDPAHPFAGVVRGVRAFRSGASAELRGAVAHGVSLRTPPLMAHPGETYRLRYQIATERLRAGGPATFGGASLLLYRFTPEEAPRAAELLADPEREQAHRLPSPSDFWVRRQRGTAPWSLQETVFTTGPAATHIVLSFDLSRAEDDRDTHQAWGSMRLDDVLLSARIDPLPLRHRELDDGAGDPHPLKLRVQLGHPVRPHATETRYAIAAPAPSSLGFPIHVSDEATLSLGYGLLPAAHIPDGPPIVFSVEIHEMAGEKHELLRRELLPAQPDRWFDAHLDLGAFAGRRVNLSLRTESARGLTGGEAALRGLPEAGAVWSYPVLHSRGDPGRLLVLVGIDTLGATRSSTYGHPSQTTPHLTAVAAQGLLFRRALSPSPWTLPAFASQLTGLSPLEHRAGERLFGERHGWRPLAPGLLTVPERLRRRGWETRAWINNPLMTRAFGLQQGFTAYVDYASQGHDEAAEPGVQEVLSYLAEPRGYDRFVFLHLMDPHGPYRSNAEFRDRFLAKDYAGRFRRPLDASSFAELSNPSLPLGDADRRRAAQFHEAAVAYADWQLGRIVEALDAAAGSGQVALIASSDHGEEFWEHGSFEHGHTMYDELLRVPLVVYAPGRTAARVAESAVSTQDVAATLLDLAGLDVPPRLASRSLLSAAEHTDDGRLLVAANTLYGVQRLMAEHEGLKYIYNQLASGGTSRRTPPPPVRHELYRLSTDPGEAKNVFVASLERALPLHEALAEPFVASLGGYIVIQLVGGRSAQRTLRAGRWDGMLRLPRGSSWDRSVRDFVWPLADGSDAPLEISLASGQSELGFRLETTRALLAFRIRDGTGPITFDLSLDGRRLAPDRVGLGESGAPPPSLPAELNEAQLPVTPRRLVGVPANGPRARIGRVAEATAIRGADLGVTEPELRLRLEALGYVAE